MLISEEQRGTKEEGRGFRSKETGALCHYEGGELGGTLKIFFGVGGGLSPERKKDWFISRKREQGNKSIVDKEEEAIWLGLEEGMGGPGEDKFFQISEGEHSERKKPKKQISSKGDIRENVRDSSGGGQRRKETWRRGKERPQGGEEGENL